MESKLGTATDPWHYARPELARKYLEVFDIGLTSARGLFAKRRMGKSEFLEKDLIPAAQAAGYLTAYLNLWDTRTQPAQALVAVLQRTLAPTGLAKLVKRLKSPIRKVKASGKVSGLAEASVEAELAADSVAAGPLLSDLLRGFDKPGQRMLLVLDEAQVLANPAHTDLAHSLRAALDSRKQTIKVVFAGSSEATLRRMFGRASEPFYNWAPLEPFELLGEDFVRAMAAKVNRLSRFPLTDEQALAAFEALQRTPEFFRRYLNQYLTHAEQGAEAALRATQATVFAGQDFKKLWTELKPADQEVLRLLAAGVQDLFSEVSRQTLARALGVEGSVSRSVVQHALKRLQDDEVVTKLDYGHYEFQDDAFKQWVLNLELT